MDVIWPAYLGLRVGDHVLGPIPTAQDLSHVVRETVFARPASQRLGPPLCRCDDPQTDIRATGPVHCRTCGRRVGSDR